MNRFVLGNGILDWTSDKLLDLLRVGARPRTEGHCAPDGNIRGLPLGHAVLAEPAPNENTHQQYPRDLWVLHKEPGSVIGLLDSSLDVYVWHELACLLDHLDGVAIYQG